MSLEECMIMSQIHFQWGRGCTFVPDSKGIKEFWFGLLSWEAIKCLSFGEVVKENSHQSVKLCAFEFTFQYQFARGSWCRKICLFSKWFDSEQGLLSLAKVLPASFQLIFHYSFWALDKFPAIALLGPVPSTIGTSKVAMTNFWYLPQIKHNLLNICWSFLAFQMLGRMTNFDLSPFRFHSSSCMSCSSSLCWRQLLMTCHYFNLASCRTLLQALILSGSITSGWTALKWPSCGK